MTGLIVGVLLPPTMKNVQYAPITEMKFNTYSYVYYSIQNNVGLLLAQYSMTEINL